MPGTISHESPLSRLRNRAAGSTPHVCHRAAVVLRELGSRFGFFESLSEIRRDKNLHPEEGVAAGGVDPRLAAGIDQGRIDTDAGREWSAELELAPALRRLRDEEAFPGSDSEYEPLEQFNLLIPQAGS
jgi:hypothetical protein